MKPNKCVQIEPKVLKAFVCPKLSLTMSFVSLKTQTT